MGLDLVELVLEVEETFSFSIRDEDAVNLDTVGKLYDYILSHRFQGREQGCLTNVVFFKLRRALMSVLGVARSDVRVSSDLNAIIPNHRRQAWADLQNVIGLRLPTLMRPKWVTVTATALGGALVVAAGVFTTARMGFATAIFPILCVAGAISYILCQATKPLVPLFRPAFVTAGGLTKEILQRNYGAISDECLRANAVEVWDILRNLIVEQLGVRPEDVTKEASFVKDLGAD